MQRPFLAKSFGEETIQIHTDNLLKELDRIKSIYGEIKVDWDLLEMACVYHDLGKINKEFQDKVWENKRHADEIPHGLLSGCFIDILALREKYSEDDIRILYYAVSYHHDRRSVREVDLQEVEEKCNELEKIAESFHYDKYERGNELSFMPKYLKWSSIEGNTNLYRKFILLKGMLNKIDYAASAYTDIEIKNDYLEDALENFMNKVVLREKQLGNYNIGWNELQKYMKSNQKKNLVVIAQTGMGKTEAGLWWIGNNKGFFTLPIRAAINAIYSRIKNDLLDGENLENRIGLLHSETQQEYRKLAEKEHIYNLDDYYTQTRQLALPLTVCTLDQLFTFVYKYRNYESKLATLSYSKIVIDEIQMYSADLVGYLLNGLKKIQDFGGSFAIITATFPGFLKDLMKYKVGLEFEMPDKAFVDDKIRHNVSWIQDKINSEFILKKYKGNRLLVICNTVKTCQSIYSALSNELNVNGDEKVVNMFHAKYIQKDREKKARDIIEFGKLYSHDGEPNKKTGIWIASSIAEASLDIDFDVLITELSDVSSLFQRMGRCYRKRSWRGSDYNCYVFDGGEKTSSGIGRIIDKELYELTKKYLRCYFKEKSGILGESEKMKLVEEILSTNNLKETSYYSNILECIERPELYLPGELSKDQAQSEFRNIHSKVIIPVSVYDDYKLEIENNIENIEKSKERKIRDEARLNIKALSLSIEDTVFSRIKKYNEIKLNSYETIYVVDCNYDEQLGFMVKEQEQDNDINDYMF